MRAKSIHENINFERGQDPMKTLGLGNEKIQDIKDAYAYVTPIIKTFKDDNIDFKKFRHKVEELKNAADILLINYLNETYDLEIVTVDDIDAYSQRFLSAHKRFAADNDVKRARGHCRIELWKNGPGNGFYYKFFGSTVTKEEGSISHSLKTFDQKFKRTLKKEGIL